LADAAILADHGVAGQAGKGFDDGVLAHADLRVDDDRLGALDRDAGQHQFPGLAGAQDAVGVRQLHPCVDAQQLARILDVHVLDAMAMANQNLRHVGQIEFTGRFVGLISAMCFHRRAARKQ
jgi:hypothetical protein